MGNFRQQANLVYELFRMPFAESFQSRNAVLSWLLPQRCLLCHVLTKSVEPLCFRCRLDAPQLGGSSCERCGCARILTARDVSGSRCAVCESLTSTLEHVRSLWSYEGRVRDVIRVMKYQPSRRIIQYCARAMSIYLAREFVGRCWDMMVPIPPQRGGTSGVTFELVETLVAFLPECAESATILKFKEKEKAYESELDPERRFRTMRLREMESTVLLEGQRILLVDDVATTGITLEAAGAALLKAGAHSVSACVLARSPLWAQSRMRLAKQAFKQRVP